MQNETNNCECGCPLERHGLTYLELTEEFYMAGCFDHPHKCRKFKYASDWDTERTLSEFTATDEAASAIEQLRILAESRRQVSTTDTADE